MKKRPPPPPMPAEEWARILGDGSLDRHSPAELLRLFDRRPDHVGDQGGPTLDDTGRAIFGHLRRLAWDLICKLVPETKKEEEARVFDIRGEVHGRVVDRILDRTLWEDRFRSNFLLHVKGEWRRHLRDDRTHATDHPEWDDDVEARASLATHEDGERAEAAEETRQRMQCARIRLLKRVPDLRHRWAVRLYLRKVPFKEMGERIGAHPETIARWVYRHVPKPGRSEPSRPRGRSRGRRT